MIVQFSKWGNSLALRIPSHALRDVGAVEGMSAELVVEAGKLVVTPMPATPRYSFDELLAGITTDNMHEDYFDAPPVGTEIR